MQLSAVLMMTAMRYFMPFLLEPYVPLYTWSDPMAVRLMAAFDSSGLGAVARFIQILAGLMLLTNRMSPFALAAVLPVNLCGLFIALFIETALVVAVLSLALVALNALLMLAQLPAYRGVLKGGALAEDESAEGGGNYNSLFANPLGRAPARAFPGAALVLAAALAFYWFVVPFANGTTGLVTLAVPALILSVNAARSLTRPER